MDVKPGELPKVVGLIGYPLRHSVSPRFQQAAFDFLGLGVRYEGWETPPDRVAEAVDRARRPDCLGINVTVPHKQAVMPLLDAVDRAAERISAVNTIKNDGGRLVGYNTDADGLVRALDDAGFVVQGRRVALLGAGGVARAAAFAFAWRQVSELVVLARRREQAQVLADAVEPDLPGRVSAGQLGAVDLGDCDLIVNCTSLGMAHSAGEGQSPLAGSRFRSDQLIYDLVYNPPLTPLLAQARADGARTLGGLPMLIYQGAAAFEIWTGRRPPIGLMMARAEEALRG